MFSDSRRKTSSTSTYLAWVAVIIVTMLYSTSCFAQNATQLLFAQDSMIPSNQSPADNLPSTIAVCVCDGTGNVCTDGNIVKSSQAMVSLTITGPTLSSPLTRTVQAMNGIATFNNLTVALSQPGLYTLTAISSPLTSISQVVGVNVPLIPPQQTIYTGAFYNPLGEQPAPGSTEDLESYVGRTLATDMHYYDWTFTPHHGAQLFPTYELKDLQAGRIPVDSWECDQVEPTDQYSTDWHIKNGDEDSNITKIAKMYKTYQGPVFVRWFWEMNFNTEPLPIPPPPPAPQNNYYCTSGNNNMPEQSGSESAPMEKHFREAWDHIRAVFEAQGVTNVIWLWNPTGLDNTGFYPGPAEVDWVGTDVYDYTNYHANSFNAVMNYAYTGLALLNKPILIGETGSPNEQISQNAQASFLNGAVPELSVGSLQGKNPNSGMPDYLGLMYFDSPGGNGYWELTTPPAFPPPPSLGAMAYKAMVKQPYLSAMYITNPAFPYSTYSYDAYVHFVPETLQGSKIPVTVTVNGLQGSTPTGTVTIYDGQNSLAVLNLMLGSGSSSATTTLTNLASGRHTLVAVYSGDPGGSPNPQGQSDSFVVKVP